MSPAAGTGGGGAPAGSQSAESPLGLSTARSDDSGDQVNACIDETAVLNRWIYLAGIFSRVRF